ncbi:MAG: phosphatase PAP2 family protein [Bacteroidota bacterium]
MLHKFLLSFLLIIICQSSLIAQEEYNFSRFKDESFNFIKQPAKWDSNDWLKLGLISAGTFLIIQTADQPIRNEVLKDRNYFKSFPIEAGRIWGEIYTTTLFAGAFGMYGIIANDNSTKKVGFEIVQAAIYSGAITQLLKVSFGRARPYTNEGTKSFYPFSFSNDFNALPSGHTTLAFSLSTVLSKNAKSDFLKIISYIPAVLTAVSRVYQDKHWASDVFLGAAIGYFVGSWVVNQHEEKESSVQTFAIYPLTIKIKL